MHDEHLARVAQCAEFRNFDASRINNPGAGPEFGALLRLDGTHPPPDSEVCLFSNDLAARAIARQTLPVQSHATWGYGSQPIAMSTNSRTKCAIDHQGNISRTPGSLRDRLRTLDILGHVVDSLHRRPSTHRTRTQSVFCPRPRGPTNPMPRAARPFRPGCICPASCAAVFADISMLVWTLVHQKFTRRELTAT
ncbi:hypothetical protein VTO73DRAFT_13973 [Trametes versicolor]